MLINTVVVAIFFLYFVIISENTNKLLNCSLQKYILKNHWFTHVMLILSIFIFTYILKWYTVDALDVSDIENFENISNNDNENDNDNDNDNNDSVKEKSLSDKANLLKDKEIVDNIRKKYHNKNKLSYLKTSLIETLIIYFVFILSTRNEGIFIVTFILILVIIFSLILYAKTINEDMFDSVINKSFIFVSHSEYNNLLKKYKNKEKDLDKIIFYEKTITILFLISLVLLLFGTYHYYIKQSKHYVKNWSWIKFLFGYNKACKV